VVGDDHLLACAGMSPLLMAASGADSLESVTAKDFDYLI
jgi:hypothetical protein